MRDYTQNIDTLERLAGISPEKLVEAHGSFAEAHCVICRKSYPADYVKEIIFNDEIPKCKECDGLVKPGKKKSIIQTNYRYCIFWRTSP